LGGVGTAALACLSGADHSAEAISSGSGCVRCWRQDWPLTEGRPSRRLGIFDVVVLGHISSTSTASRVDKLLDGRHAASRRRPVARCIALIAVWTTSLARVLRRRGRHRNA
jgi:hypothetical protein